MQNKCPALLDSNLLVVAVGSDGFSEERKQTVHDSSVHMYNIVAS